MCALVACKQGEEENWYALRQYTTPASNGQRRTTSNRNVSEDDWHEWVFPNYNHRFAFHAAGLTKKAQRKMGLPSPGTPRNQENDTRNGPINFDKLEANFKEVLSWRETFMICCYVSWQLEVGQRYRKLNYTLFCLFSRLLRSGQQLRLPSNDRLTI